MKPIALLSLAAFALAVSVEPHAQAQTSASPPDESRKKATPAAPEDVKAVAGKYHHGDGLGVNIRLTLNVDGKFAAVWHGCLGKYGESSGTWTLADKLIVFTPAKEEGMLKGYLKSLGTAKFEGDWVLTPTDKRWQKFYEDWGVNEGSCYIKEKEKK